MRRRRVIARRITSAWLGALLPGLMACLGAPPSVPVPAQSELPAEVAAVAATQPTIVRVKGQLWVVGLPARHGWARERRVLLTQRDPKHGIAIKVGVVVVLDDSYPTAAPVGIVYEELKTSFDGAQATVVSSDQRLRIGRGFGSVRQVITTTTLELDLGRQDGVAAGDIYEVRARDGVSPLGRVRVVSLEDTRATAEVINPGVFAIGQEVVYQPKSEAEYTPGPAVSIVVCDFEPKARAESVAQAGQAFAFDLAKHLKAAAGDWKGLAIKQVPQMVGDDEQARKLGREHRADVVVWGTAMCAEGKGCALPVFTMVDPKRLSTARFEGREVRFEALNPGAALERGTAKDPAGLVFALLGALSVDAQRYADAAFYLSHVPKGVQEGTERFRSLGDLTDAYYVLGRIEFALDTTGKLEQEARGQSRIWEMVGVGRRARILADKGRVDEALKLHKERVRVFGELGDLGDRAVTLTDIAGILTLKGQLEDALKLYDEALKVFEELGDRRSRAVTLGHVALILKNKGQVDEALTLLNQALKLLAELGDRRARSAMMGNIALILEEKGHIEDALKLHNEALKVDEELGDRRSRAMRLGNIASILRDKGQIDESLKLYNEALKVFEELGDRRLRSWALSGIAAVLTQKGQVDDALELHKESLKIDEELGDRESRAQTLGAIAGILRNKGQLEDALKLYNEALKVFEELSNRRFRAGALGSIASILRDKGQIDESLKLHNEALKIFDELGDRRSRAGTLREIARILTDKGQVDEALKLYNDALKVLEELGDRRTRAISVVDVAQILTGMGRVDEALKLNIEALKVFEELGDRRSRAGSLYSIARLHLSRQDIARALPLLREAYDIVVGLGDASGTAFVGETLASTLIQMSAKKAEAEPIVSRASEAFIKIGKPDRASALRARLASP